jgi:SWIM zinc finger
VQWVGRKPVSDHGRRVPAGGPAYRCSCPSRKFPCKHALALLLNWANGLVPQAPVPDFAMSWIVSRLTRASAPARPAGSARPPGERDQQAAARRAERRAARVAAGLAELDTWLCDQVRTGLSADGPGYQLAEPMAARMVDAQAPGIAAALRRLAGIPASGDGWPGRLLAEYAQLHLLARAHTQLDTLPAGLAEVVRSHVGYPTTREDVLTRPAVTDRWLVLGSRDLLDGTVPARRVWLRGQQTGQFALLLMFDYQGTFGGNPEATLTAGTMLRADVHYYPGQPQLRAVLGRRQDEPGPAGPACSPGGIPALLDDWADVLACDPWLSCWPALVPGIPVPAGDGWRLADPSGASVPLLTAGIDVWPLVAISGGAPAVVAGEWNADGLRPLTAWHGDTAVTL